MDGEVYGKTVVEFKVKSKRLRGKEQQIDI